MNLLEITGEDIAMLSDTDLRVLIGRLCEADFLLANLSSSCIRYSGHQDAKDGGIDVSVNSKTSPPIKSFIPRGRCGFQVKKPAMGPADIKTEMMPNGLLRPKIKELLDAKGAYIIVSSGSSVTDTAYDSRIKAMKEIIKDEANNDDVSLDFYDSNRIANWVRCHPSLILWVQHKIGRPIQGWQPYANWANSPGGIDDEYILDEKLRLFDGESNNDAGLSVIDGISLLREKLTLPGGSVRLAGLSGVGKTRLVQALFDKRIGENSLNPLIAFYTDISDGPSPDPRSIAQYLTKLTEKVILIIDNCTPELHRNMTRVCRNAANGISLLTIEYDVREDIPEETKVFRLQTASVDVIEKIIVKRFSYIGQVDARRIAEFSDGNARVAIALAGTFKKGETLSGFKDEQLFVRLFQQRNNEDLELLRSAEVCSLLYSFEGTKRDENSELNILSSLINRSGDDIFRDVKILRDRELVQSRGIWRAVLPHAIANRLAKRALQTIPLDKIVDVIVREGQERIVVSFSRRLGYLHDCESAVKIVKGWLAPRGWIGESAVKLSAFAINVLQNVAPVCPEDTLKLIERSAQDPEKGEWYASRSNPDFEYIVRLLRLLAYEPRLFCRSVKLLAKFASTEREDENHNSIRDLFKSLFHIYLSGTYASLEDRASLIEEFLNSDEVAMQRMGLLALDAALRTWHFSSHYDISFGARPRDFGLQPKGNEVDQWFACFIKIATNHALAKKETSYNAKLVLADKMRGLWVQANAFDAIEESVKAIKDVQSWNEGWIACCSTLRYDGKEMADDIRERLSGLSSILRPEDLENLVRTYALSDKRFIWDLDDELPDDVSTQNRIEKITIKRRELGSQLAYDTELLDKLLPELLSDNSSSVWELGEGLCAGAGDKRKMWQKLEKAAGLVPNNKCETALLCGFMSEWSKWDPVTHNEILDNIIGGDLLAKWFPQFQVTTRIDKRGVERLIKSLNEDKATANQYIVLGWGRSHESIADDDLADILSLLLKKYRGFIVVIDILKMRFHRDTETTFHSDKLLGITRKVLVEYDFATQSDENGMLDHSLGALAKVCLVGGSQVDSARIICNNLYNEVTNGRLYSRSYRMLMSVLSKNYPHIFLDVFLETGTEGRPKKYRIFWSFHDMDKNPIMNIDNQKIIEWCDINPTKRYSLIIDALILFERDSQSQDLKWRDVVLTIFDKAPKLDIILNKIGEFIRPSSWSNSLADVLQKRLKPLKDLLNHPNAEIASWAQSRLAKLKIEIEEARKWEEDRESIKNESFE